ncbi:osmotically inducible protein C [Falsiroseomonas bella]|uniref:Osmotically inducible protein C n=1 Tax=Falsiroseomonas bella TaxID=2184016 RepID=A0A317FCF6_9PROT|nr:OsmC family protein [Falsiroseomonas bella]PWS35639.1 osmotically inducible protein C [Falsiroseomonas bella]
MSATAETAAPVTAKAPPPPRHGVNTPALFATINVVKGQPELAKFQFRAKSAWQSGTHMRSTMESFAGAGGEHAHKAPTVADSDHPAVLCGEDAGPTPVEWLLHALAGCLTAGIANIAAARGVTLTKVEATVEGDIDLRGILGLSDEVRNGFEEIRISFDIAGDAPAEKLQEIVRQSVARSAVFDMLTNGLPVTVSAKA